MFNVKIYRIKKKNYTVGVFIKNRKKSLTNVILKKNSRILNYKSIVMVQNIRFLVAGSTNVCSITGKYKSTFNSLRVSRHVFRNLGETSFLPNYSKLSWLCLNLYLWSQYKILKKLLSGITIIFYTLLRVPNSRL